jgi:hypothetical protein
LIIFLFTAKIDFLGQSNTFNKLSRRNPEKWFNILTPKKIGNVERPAGGGFRKTQTI